MVDFTRNVDLKRSFLVKFVYVQIELINRKERKNLFIFTTFKSNVYYKFTAALIRILIRVDIRAIYSNCEIYCFKR